MRAWSRSDVLNLLMLGWCSHRRDCPLITPPCNFSTFFNRDKFGVPSK